MSIPATYEPSGEASRRASNTSASSASTLSRESNRRGPKHVSAPVWQAGPAGRTRIRIVSPSQSLVIDSTAMVLPEVSPLSHRRSREREWKWARPVRTVASSAGLVGACSPASPAFGQP